MTWEVLVALLVGGGGMTGLLSAYFTRKSSKEKNDIELLDRAYAEIERMDTRMKELEKALDVERKENRELRETIFSLKQNMEELQVIIKKLKEEN